MDSIIETILKIFTGYYLAFMSWLPAAILFIAILPDGIVKYINKQLNIPVFCYFIFLIILFFIFPKLTILGDILIVSFICYSVCVWSFGIFSVGFIERGPKFKDNRIDITYGQSILYFIFIFFPHIATLYTVLFLI